MTFKKINSAVTLPVTKLALGSLPFLSIPFIARADDIPTVCEEWEGVAHESPCLSWSDPDITVGTLLTKIFGWVIVLVGGIAVLFLIYGGLQYVTSSGNKDRAEAAKKTITYAVIGLIVIVLARVIISLTTNTAGSILK